MYFSEVRKEGEAKSKDYYIKDYSAFKDWCKFKNVLKVSENAFLVKRKPKAEKLAVYEPYFSCQNKL